MILEALNFQSSQKNSKTNIKKNYKKDESDNLINKLFSVFRNHINQLKNNITFKKDKLIYIDSSTNYANSIVNNIIKHNYSFEQLKSLEDTIIQIKEQCNLCTNKILEEEQNLNLFTEEIKKLIKSIDAFYKKKYNDYSKKRLTNSIKNRNDSNLKNGFNYNNNYNNNYSLSDPFFISKEKDSQKRNKSQGSEMIQNENNYTNKSQMSMRSKNSSINNTRSDSKFTKTRSLLNERRNYNCLKLANNNLNKAQSTYNIDLNKNDLLNANSNNFMDLKSLTYKNLLSKYQTIKKQNEDYENSNIYLKKQIFHYKNIIDLLNKQGNNKGIIEKTKQISALQGEVQNLKRQLESKNSRSKLDFRTNQKNIRYFDTDNVDTYDESDINNNTGISSSSLKKNGGKREKEAKPFRNENLMIKMKNSYKDKLLDKESNAMIINFKNKIKQYEIEINKLREKIKNEIDKNEELRNICQNQKIKFEHEIATINDKRTELSRFLFNKNDEIIKLQNDLFLKTKELEQEKEKNKLGNKNKMKSYYEKIINEKNTKQLELNKSIDILKEENELLKRQNENNKNEIIELNGTVIQYERQLYQKNEEISKIQTDKINDMKKQQNSDNNIEVNKLKKEIDQLKEKIKNNNSEEVINKLKEENEGLKQFFFKMKDKEEKLIEDNSDLKDKISSLKKENDAYKAYFNDKKVNLTSLSEYNKNMKRDIENKNLNLNDVLIELNNAKKEINTLKKKNEDLFNELESKKFDNDFCDHFSENKAVSNYEEEFDLKKMAKGAKDKNRSQDINIDYPGAQQVKEKFRELDYYYNSLEELVKKLLLNCTCTNKNRTYITELCKIVGFNEEVINKIVNNKSKKGLLSMLV